MDFTDGPCTAVPPDPGIGTPGGRGPARGHQRRIVLPPRGPCVRAGPRFSPTGIGVCMYCPPRRGTGGRGARRMMAWHGMAWPQGQQHAPVRELLPVLLGWVDRQAPGSSATLWFPAFLARFCSRHGRKGPREKRWVQLPVPMASWDRRRLALWLVSCSTNSGPSASASARLLAERPDFADSSEDRTN